MVGLIAGGFFVYKNVSQPEEKKEAEKEEVSPVTEEKAEEEEAIETPEEKEEEKKEEIIPQEEGPKKVSNTTRRGTVYEDEIWSGEILVTDDIIIQEGVALTIEPGTTIKFKHWRHGYTEPKDRIPMTIFGRLIVKGTAAHPIRFTSNAAQPEHGDWGSVVIRDKGEAIIDYSIIEYGMAPVSFLASNSKKLLLSNSILRWSTGANIFIGHGSKAILENNRIYGAGHNNIEIEGFGTEVVIRGNVIFNASNGGIVVLDNSKATIEHNIIFGNKGITPHGIAGMGIVTGSNGYATTRYNTIKQHTGAGIIINPYGSALIEYNNIQENSVGIQTNQFPKKEKIVVGHNNFDNRDFNIQILAETDFVDARLNWFSTTDKDQIALKIQSEEDGNFGKVEYEPYLTKAEDKDITIEIEHDYEDYSKYEHQAATENDVFLYSFPGDTTRKVVDRIFESGFPTGIAYDGQDFWVSVTDSNEIYKIDQTGKVLKKLPSPGPWPYGLVWDGGHLWLAGYTESKIYKLDKEGSVLDSFPSPVVRPVSLAFDGKYLWTCSFGGEPKPPHYFYKFDREGNLISKIRVDREFTGLTWHDGFLWASMNYAFDRIYKLDPQTGKILGWINSSGDRTYGLVWAKGYLWTADWTCEQWKEKKIFKLQTLQIKK